MYALADTVTVWVDNMVTSPLLMEGTYDKDKKQMTMTGDGPSPAGTVKFKSVTTFTDDDNVAFDMYAGDAKDPAFTIVYKRKK